MAAGDELVEVVDLDDTVIEVVSRRRMRAENLRHRSVGILLLNSAGEVLIHRRADHKDVWPGQWDIAAGGVVGAGETYEDAARRELAEEVGVTGVPLELLGDGRYEDERVRANVRLFRAVWDGPVRFDDGEVVEAEWVTVDELRERVARDRFVPDSRALGGRYLGLS